MVHSDSVRFTASFSVGRTVYVRMCFDMQIDMCETKRMCVSVCINVYVCLYSMSMYVHCVSVYVPMHVACVGVHMGEGLYKKYT